MLASTGTVKGEEEQGTDPLQRNGTNPDWSRCDSLSQRAEVDSPEMPVPDNKSLLTQVVDHSGAGPP